ncbi:kinesin-like protein KIF21A isoform X1 [Eriocheir sinensis]|uniref:kinesin-like protein KIF21A isoform X1 n=1 Tax=Eriocheir sinensis TaxID=95602 RepID=UPI0021C704D4|nr:kinesin-like protein KIF21A isoform X1 [Eriocheir sinensis]
MGDESSVRVAIRIRPQIARELIDMCRVCTSVTPGEPQVWLGSDKAFTYDHVFDQPAGQTEVYESCVAGLIEGCFEGYNATVLAYGQTGSGKTYTMGTGLEMEGDPAFVGIIPRAVEHLFRGIDERREAARATATTPPEFKVTAHFMELYNEEIIDLFEPGYKGSGKGGIRIHEDAEGGIYVTGVTTRNVTSLEETMQCLRAGALSRTTGSTNMNTQSSRSHAIFTLLVRQQRIAPVREDDGEEGGSGEGGAPQEGIPEFETLTAKFHFVDLAGSERLKRTGATGERAREGISINCGLLALGNVISALGDVSKRASHVPYRDSKLTRLLQDSLGGNSRTLMIACISPSDTDFMETLNTLKYANRARNIKNKVMVNQDKASKAIAILRQEIQQLRVELMEYKQGKRIVGEDGSEAVNDMYHENQMLSTEIANMRTRLKALQETVEVLTAKAAALLAEKATSGWITSGEGVDMATVIQGYLKEIEELRAKLCESENLCQQLRKQLNNRANNPARLSMSPMHVPMSGSMYGCVDDAEEGQTFTQLIEEAKRDLNRDLQEVKRKKRASGGSGGEDDDEEDDDEEENEEEEEGEMEENYESSDESGEDKENYNEELAELTSEISIKQKLIEGLELSQRRLETMRHQYEDKLNVLMNRIRATQEERDKVIANIKSSSSAGDDKVKSVKQEYERRICNMQNEMKKLQAAQKEHAKLMRERGQHERQLRTLKADLAEMKKTKVRLMNKMKEDNTRAKQEELKKNREIAQLRKASRKQETYIKSLEAENRLKNVVLKRKTEEIAVLKKAPRQGLSSKASGRLRKRVGLATQATTFSPKVAKQKWQSLEQNINKVAYNKQTVSSMERDMERWLKERESLSRQLERVMRKRERADPADMTAYNDLNDQVEALRANIDYIHENIQECQDNIMSMEESKEQSDLLSSDAVTTGLGKEESHYLISKLINMTVNQATLAAQRQAAISELEGKMKQMEQTTSVQEQLLAHVLGDKDLEVYSLMSSLVAAEDNTPASTESSRSNSPTDGLMETSATSLVSLDSLKRRDKARRKTATTEDMLFTNGSEKNGNLGATSTDPTAAASGPTSLPERSTTDRMTVSLGTDRMSTSLEGVLSDEGLLMPPPSSSSSGSLRPVPRVTSAPNPLKNLLTPRPDKASPVLSRKSYERAELTSPRLGRRSLTSLSASNLNFSRQNSADNNPECTPPTSPTTYRRSTSRDENVFSRLTSATSSTRETRPNTGVINPHAGRATQRSVLACTHVAQGHSKAVLSVHATDDLLFSASKDRTVKVWDLVRGQEIQSLGGHPNNVNCVRYCEAQHTCFSVSSSFIKVWDIRENPARCTRTLSSAGLTSVGFPVPSTQSRTLQMPPGETLITDVAISTATNILYSAAGNIVRIWDLRKHSAVGKLAGGHQAAVMCLAVDSTVPGQDVVATGSKDHYIKVFDITGTHSGLVNPRLNLEPPHYDGIQSLALYGDTLFSGSRDMCIKKWDLQRGEHVQSLNNAHKDWVCALCFTPGGQIVLSGCRGGMIKMWSAESCQLIGELRAHASPINAITTNSTCIFTASNDCTIGMWRMRTSYDVSPELSDAS